MYIKLEVECANTGLYQLTTFVNIYLHQTFFLIKKTILYFLTYPKQEVNCDIKSETKIEV